MVWNILVALVFPVPGKIKRTLQGQVKWTVKRTNLLLAPSTTQVVSRWDLLKGVLISSI